MDSHIPVLINQVTEFLNPRPGRVFIDCTLGVGGHTEALLKKMNGKGAVYGIEVDERNIALAKAHLASYPNVTYLRDSYENVAQIAREVLEKEGKINGILFDLGISSLHIDDPERGFSFQHEGPLDMRFDTRQKLTAADIVNTYPLEKLLFIFQAYGEEKFSYRIARAILGGRSRKRFTTTTELADCIGAVVPKSRRFGHKRNPATRVFQALRIATNREIEVAEEGVRAAIEAVSPGGRVVVISYHSLEDRIVKNLFRDAAKAGTLILLTKKPLYPEEEELLSNPRSRSAHLRVAEKL